MSSNIFDLLLKNITGDTYKINVKKNDNILNCRLKTASEVGQPIENIRFLKNTHLMRGLLMIIYEQES